jgi:hypothetical protein
VVIHECYLAMPGNFDDRKAKILAELSTPDEQYQDLSPKGSVDAGIRDLIAEINALPDYVTTSSCAGRIAVYLEGAKGAKGGGQWLFTSHDPVDVPAGDGEVFRMLGLPNKETSVPGDSDSARFVHFKYEPMVCSSTNHIFTILPSTRHITLTEHPADPPHPNPLSNRRSTGRFRWPHSRVPRKRH